MTVGLYSSADLRAVMSENTTTTFLSPRKDDRVTCSPSWLTRVKSGAGCPTSGTDAVESLMAAIAQGTPDAKARMAAFLEGRANKVKEA